MLRKKQKKEITLSIVTPAYNEAQNLPLLYQRLKKTLDPMRLSWEWIVVDDHSADTTFQTVESIARRDERVACLRFTKNSGSHLALACALRAARGLSAVGLAADLQDPPELIGELLKRWRKGAKIVWAARAKREGESLSTLFFARFYYFIVRYGVGLRQVPPTGADFFLLDRVVLEALRKAQVKNASILLLICSLGFKEDFITYTKRERAHGKSGWSLRKKIKLFIDSVTMFSKAPIWWLTGVGLTFFLAGLTCIYENFDWNGCPISPSLILILSGLLALLGGFLLWLRGMSPTEPAYRIEKTTQPC